MENITSQDINITQKEKSVFWKVGMVVVSYFVTVIPTAFILGFIWTSIVLIGFSHSIADVQKVSNYFLIISFLFNKCLEDIYGNNYFIFNLYFYLD